MCLLASLRENYPTRRLSTMKYRNELQTKTAMLSFPYQRLHMIVTLGDYVNQHVVLTPMMIQGSMVMHPYFEASKVAGHYTN